MVSRAVGVIGFGTWQVLKSDTETRGNGDAAKRRKYVDSDIQNQKARLVL